MLPRLLALSQDPPSFYATDSEETWDAQKLIQVVISVISLLHMAFAISARLLRQRLKKNAGVLSGSAVTVSVGEK